MRTRTTLTLAIVAAALAVPTTIELIRDRGTFTEYDTIPRLFEGFRPEAIQLIQISRAKPTPVDAPPPEPGAKPERETIAFARSTEGWVLFGQTDLNGVPVQTSKIDGDLLDRVKEIRRDVRALYKAQATPEDLAEAGLDADQATLIQCFDGNRTPMAELFVGKDASGGKFGEGTVRGWLVRRRNGPEDKGPKDIILYEPDPHWWELSPEPNHWIDNIVHQFSFDDMVACGYRNGKGEVAFAKDGNDWKATTKPEGAEGAVRGGEVDQIFSQFSLLQISRYIEPLAKHEKLADFGLGQGRIEVFAQMADGTEYRLFLGKKIEGTNERYARVGGGKYLLAVGEWMLSLYQKDPRDLFDPAAPPSKQKEEGEDKPGAGK